MFKTPGVKALLLVPCFCTEGLRWALRGHKAQRWSDLKF